MTLGAEPQICSRCVLPTTFPGLDVDEDGVCQYCRAEPDAQAQEDQRAQLKQKLESAIDVARESDGSYQCIVAYSGGKDSTYTLLMLAREYGLRCLAVTVDNGFLSDVAIENCKNITDTLGVDHVFFKPAFGFMRGLYTKSLEGGVHAPAAIKRASDVCSSCINLINAHMITVAAQNNVSLIAGGYLGGQVPKDSAVLDINLDRLRKTRSAAMASYKKRFGHEATRFFSIPEAGGGNGSNITVINPMLTVAYHESELIEEIAKYGWRRPTDTGGHSSNCRLNDVGIFAHQKRYGFHPYVFELAELVRKGFADRQQALEKLSRLPNPGDFGDILEKLGIEEADLGRQADASRDAG